MVSSLRTACAACFLFAGLVGRAYPQNPTTPPYASIATGGEEYAGPGRSLADDLTGPVTFIGLLAPLHGARKLEGDAMVAAAQMALRDAAPRGTPRQRRVEIAVEDSSASWGLVSDAVIRLVLKDQVVALVTSSSRADAHLAEQVGNRVGLSVLTLSADATTTQGDIPWIFRLGGTDAAEAQCIAHEIYAVHPVSRVLLVTQQGDDTDRVPAAMLHAAAAVGAVAPGIFAMQGLDSDIHSLMTRIHAESPQAIVVLTDAALGLRILPALQDAGVKVPTYFSQDAASQLPDQRADHQNVSAAWTVADDLKPSSDERIFARRFEQITGQRSTAVATRTYDAVTLMVRALQSAGPNRARVRDVLSQTRHFSGASGEVTFDREGNDQVTFRLVQLP